MKSRVVPERTYVISVGIATYDIGPDWDLPNAGQHAVEFAIWAKSAGVPAEQIYLFLAKPDQAKLQAKITRYRLNPPRLATREGIDGFITSQEFQDLEGDLLYTFWSGHGSVTDEDERHLFYADVRKGFVPALDFSHFLRRLRSAPLGKFALQNSYVDACANRYDDLQLKVNLSTTNVGTSGVLADIDQRAIFSADSGNEAIAGEFSAFLLQQLRALSKGGLWPPNSDTIADAVCANPALFGQHPQQFWILTKAKSSAIVIGEPPARDAINIAAARAECSLFWLRSLAGAILGIPAFETEADLRSRLYCAATGRQSDDRIHKLSPLNDVLESIAVAFAIGRDKETCDALGKLDTRGVILEPEFRRILLLRDARSLVAECSFDPQTLSAVYAAAATPLARTEKNAATMPLAVMLYELAQAELCDDAFKKRSLYEFILRLAEVRDLPVERAQKLRTFVRHNAPVGIPAEIERKLQAERRFLLIFRVDQLEESGPFGLSADLMTESFADIDAWKREECPSVGALKERVGVIVREVKAFLLQQKRLDDDVLDVEFLMPLDLFNLAPEDFPIGVKPVQLLGDLFPVVLRWLDRYETPDEHFNPDWKRIAQSIPQNSRCAVKWLTKEDFEGSRSCFEHKKVLGLSFLPKTEFETLVEGGAPFVVWPRSEPPCGFDKMRVHISKWAKNHRTGEVRRRLKSLRKQYRDASNGVSVFWDDPARDYRFFHEDVIAGEEGA